MYKDYVVFTPISRFQCILHFCVVAFIRNYRIKFFLLIINRIIKYINDTGLISTDCTK